MILYFSASGNTQTVAETIGTTLGADVVEIQPSEPYTDEDLNWSMGDARVNREHEDPDSRPNVDLSSLPDLSNTNTVYLGYPLWWSRPPQPVLTFLDRVDLSGKTMIPFCTSQVSPISTSVELLRSMYPNVQWQDGQRFPENASAEDVAAWLRQ